jgi:hypothetical protein
LCLWGYQNGGMKRVLGLSLGLFGIVLASSLTAQRRPNSNHLALGGQLGAAEGDVAPVYLVPARGAPKRLGARATMQVGSARPAAASIHAALSESANNPLWLSELNLWRRMAGLEIVAENASLSYGSEEHARYLVVQGPPGVAGFRAYDRTLGPGAHLEDSRSPFYTRVGAEAAIGGPLAADVIQGADVAWEGQSEAGDIDNLIAAPFHRLSLLAPWAQIVGYGSFGEYPRRAAALALRGPLKRRRRGEPIEFPPSNSDIPLGVLRGSEWPNPVAPCAGYERPTGLPITLQIGRRLVLQSYSLRDRATSDRLQACGFDALTYRNPDALQQKRGRELLTAYGAVVVIPRKPLLSGHQYLVTAQTSLGRFEWAFTVNAAAKVHPIQAERTPTRQLAATR